MNRLYNLYTNIEQSKRLLELGLPADSADVGIIDDVMHGIMEILYVPYSQWCQGYENISYPCWSVGRLIEIFRVYGKNAGEWALFANDDKRTLIEWMMDIFESKVDFSKLEDEL